MRVLLTGVSTRALSQSARAVQVDIVALDYFGDYDQKQYCESYGLARDFGLSPTPTQLYQASRHLRYDAIVYTASLENHPRIVARLAGTNTGGGKRVLLGNSPETLARVRQWPAFFACVERLGLAGPVSHPAGQEAPPEASVRWLRKPIRSGGGHGIGFWSSDRPVGNGFLLQEYVPGRSGSLAFLANGREAVVLGLTEQLIGRPEFGGAGFAYCGNVFPWPTGTDAAMTDLLVQAQILATGLTREFNLVGLNGVDFVVRDGRICPLEVNPRYTAAMELMEQVRGWPLFAWHVEAVQTGALPQVPAGEAAGDFAGKAILYAEQACRAPDTRHWPERGIRDVPFPGDEFAPGWPVCTVLASGPSGPACHAALAALAVAIRGELYA